LGVGVGKSQIFGNWFLLTINFCLITCNIYQALFFCLVGDCWSANFLRDFAFFETRKIKSKKAKSRAKEKE